MFVPRSLAMRLTAAVALSLLLCAVGYLGLGWTTRAQPSWLLRLLGDRGFSRLYDSYGRVAAALGPDDRDGDGVCDGAEFFCQSDPGNPAQHPDLYIGREAGGIITELCGIVSDDGEPFDVGVSRRSFWIAAEERGRGRFAVSQRLQLPSMPRGFRVRLTPPDWLLLGPPGGSLAPVPLILPVTDEGLFVFDAQVQSPEDDPESALRADIAVHNAATGERLLAICVHRVRKLQTFVPTVESVSLDRWRQDPGDRLESVRIPTLRWPGPTDDRSGLADLLIETARDEADAPWHTIAYAFSRREDACVFRRRMSGFRKPYTGPVKYRVTTIHRLME